MGKLSSKLMIIAIKVKSFLWGKIVTDVTCCCVVILEVISDDVFIIFAIREESFFETQKQVLFESIRLAWAKKGMLICLL